MFEFGPILRTLWRNKTGALLIMLQSALTLAIVANAAFVLQQRLQLINQPTGIDEQHLFTIDVKSLDHDLMSVGDIQRDISAIRQLSGVVDASYIGDKPLSGSVSRSENNVQEDGTDIHVSASQLNIDPHGLNSLGVKLLRGRFFNDTDMMQELGNAKVTVINQAVADAGFGKDAEVIGKQISFFGVPVTEKTKMLKGAQMFTVIGITADANINSVASADDGVMFLPLYDRTDPVSYLVRCEPNACQQLMLAVPDTLKQLDNHRMISGLATVMDNKYQALRRERTMVVMMTAAIVLVSGVTGLGVIGLTLLWVNRRRRQIGVRRALGASRWSIVRYFLTENVLVTCLGLCLGVVLALGLNQLMMQHYQMTALPLSYLLGSMLAVIVLGLVAAVIPAWRSSFVSPAVATRSV